MQMEAKFQICTFWQTYEKILHFSRKIQKLTDSTYFLKHYYFVPKLWLENKPLYFFPLKMERGGPLDQTEYN